MLKQFDYLTHIDCQQGTPEWLAQRAGLLTASRAAAAMLRNQPTAAETKAGLPGKFSARRRHLANALALERLTGTPAYDAPFKTDAMSRGTDLEPIARLAYMNRTGVELEETGFWRHPSLMVGASFDGLTADRRRGIEVKCLWPSNHVEVGLALRADGWRGIPPEYWWQIVHEFAWMPLEQIDFCLFCPEMPNDAASLIVCPVYRAEHEEALDNYRTAVVEFEDEIESARVKIEALSAPAELA